MPDTSSETQNANAESASLSSSLELLSGKDELRRVHGGKGILALERDVVCGHEAKASLAGRSPEALRDSAANQGRRTQVAGVETGGIDAKARNPFNHI